MKKRLLIAAVLALALSLTVVAPASAKVKDKSRPLVVTETMTAGLQDHPDTWYGSVSGAINGSEESWGCSFDPGLGAVSPILLGGASPGYNLIITDCGTITFYSMGIYIDAVWEFRNVGFVTDARGQWEYLLGWITYAYGVTADPNTWAFPYTCTGYRVFLPPLPAKWGSLGA
jgi:hypothetical protein